MKFKQACLQFIFNPYTIHPFFSHVAFVLTGAYNAPVSYISPRSRG